MNFKKVLIELDVSQIQVILRIDMHENADKALAFIKETLAKQVKASLQSH